MDNKTFRQRAIRHGEVMIVPIDTLPGNLEQVENGRRIVIGHSETGHHHVAVCELADLTMFRPVGADSPDLFLRVSQTARVEHLKTFDAHETKTLQPGAYKITTKSGYDYFLKRMTQVMD